MVGRKRAVADTSIFIGLEVGRFDAEEMADYDWGVSAVTLGELRLGVLQARDAESAAQRLSTYQAAQRCLPLPVDEDVSNAWALLISRLREKGMKAPLNDSWIAATAIAHGVPVLTQDADYDAMPGLAVIKPSWST